MSDNESVMLPTGDFLRQLIGQPKVKEGELKNILRARGVFVGSSKKDVTGPLLVKTGLSPLEYIELKDSYKSREESRKLKTRTIGWNSDTSLIDAIPEEIKYEELLNDLFGVYSVASASDFTAKDGNPDHLYMDFSIQRDDPIKNFGANQVEYSGQIEIKKSESGKLLTILLMHTAPETQSFAGKLSDTLVKHFKDTGHVDNDETLKAIRFFDFTNEGRIKFLNVLTQQPLYTDLTFTDMMDVHFSPDHSFGEAPEGMSWMKGKIEDLKMKGKALESTFFVQDATYYPFVKLFGVQCDYTLNSTEYSGTCRLLFEFSERDQSVSSELSINLIRLSLEYNRTSESKEQLKKKILASFEKYKIEVYDKYRS